MKRLRSVRIAVVAMAFMMVGGTASASAAEFHAPGGPGAGLTRLNMGDDVTFQLQGITITCGLMSQLGETTAASMPSTELNVYLEECEADGIPGTPTWSTNGCWLEYHASGTVDLKSCKAGGIVFEWSIPWILKCKVVFPNQTGMTGIIYTNAKYKFGKYEVDMVLFDQDLSLTADVVTSTGFCPVEGEGVAATFGAFSEVAAAQGLSIS